MPPGTLPGGPFHQRKEQRMYFLQIEFEPIEFGAWQAVGAKAPRLKGLARKDTAVDPDNPKVAKAYLRDITLGRFDYEALTMFLEMPQADDLERIWVQLHKRPGRNRQAATITRDVCLPSDSVDHDQLCVELQPENGRRTKPATPLDADGLDALLDAHDGEPCYVEVHYLEAN